MRIDLLIAAILREVWAISYEEFVANQALLVKLLSENYSSEGITLGDFPLSIVARSGEVIGSTFDKAPDGSVAIISLKGVMMKEDTLCSYGTESIGERLMEAADHKKISAAIIDTHSGGGSVNSVPPLVEAIEYAKKKMPVIGLGDTVASAAYYALSATDKIIAANNFSSQFGSIGVMIQFADATEQLKNQGIKMHTIYAPESTHKNKPFELALEGKYDLIKKEMLSPLAIKFQDAVKNNRPNLDKEIEGILNGKMFYADDALKHGLIDGVGNMEFAIKEALNMSKTKQFNINTNSKIESKMNKELIAVLLGILGVESLEMQDGKISLSEAQVNKIKSNYKETFGKELKLENLEFEEGHASFTEAEIVQIEGALGAEPPKKEEEDDNNDDGSSASDKALKQLEARVDQMELDAETKDQTIKMLKENLGKVASQPHTISLSKKKVEPVAAGGKTMEEKFIMGEEFPWNQVDASRPWNMRAAGLEVTGSSLDIDTIIDDLGDYSRQRRDEIRSFLRPDDRLESIFPTIGNVNDEMVSLNIFAGEFTQAYQGTWTPKGDFTIEDEIIKMFPIKIDHVFSELKAIETTWISDRNREGSNAYKLSFVGFLVKEMLMKAGQEDNIAAIKGVYQAPVSGEAGRYLNKMNGILQIFKNKIENLQIKPFELGEWTKDNILDYERDFVESIPEYWRDLPGMAIYVSLAYIDAKYNKKKEVEGRNINYDPAKSTVDNYENIRLIAVPNMGVSKRVFASPIGNIRQFEFIPGENKFVIIEQSKRETNVIIDYKKAIYPLAVGKKHTTVDTQDYETQLVWMNDVDEPVDYYVKMDEDETTPSVSLHTSIETIANTGATEITNIDDAEVGDEIRIKGGADTNSSTITDGGNFDLTADWTAEKGNILILRKRSDGKFVEIDRIDETEDALEFTADDATPDVAAGLEFITSATNSGALEITNLDNAVVGSEYTIFGVGGANATTINDGGNFVLQAAWTDLVGTYIKLYMRDDDVLVEVERG